MEKVLEKFSRERARKRSLLSTKRRRTEKAFNLVGIHPDLMKSAMELASEIVKEANIIAKTHGGRHLFEITPALLPPHLGQKLAQLKIKNEVQCEELFNTAI